MDFSIWSRSSSIAALREVRPECWVASKAMLVPTPARPIPNRVAMIKVVIGSLFARGQTAH
jgi:hypothetical protein